MVTEIDARELAKQLGQALNTCGKVIATAESCTGGWIAQVITSVPGASVWFERGFVVYSNTAKREMLGVDAEILAQYGAVSEQTAAAMARGAITHSNATLTVSVTGIAGPGGGTPEKPVGMVCMAWAEKPGSVDTETFYFEGDRDAIRCQAVVAAIEGLLARAKP